MIGVLYCILALVALTELNLKLLMSDSTEETTGDVTPTPVETPATDTPTETHA